eukprot:TRINITY_DN785_c0_g1_i4.p1 TRINITY_DN785_c0_g1~~TRINITY_DN785_c0_g1_i4.p1  ORF type:complete len:530 (+),score=189.43 TRINITY_DN785_c0_g1_i4:61-1650(+)
MLKILKSGSKQIRKNINQSMPNLKAQRIPDAKKVFKKHANKKKMVDRPGFCAALMELHLINNEKVGNELFAKCDMDNSGLVDVREFLLAATSLDRSTASPKDQMMLQFRIWDLDDDGKLSRDEVEAILSATTCDNVRMLLSDFDAADESGDGFIDEMEFAKLTANASFNLDVGNIVESVASNSRTREPIVKLLGGMPATVSPFFTDQGAPDTSDCLSPECTLPADRQKLLRNIRYTLRSREVVVHFAEESMREGLSPDILQSSLLERAKLLQKINSILRIRATGDIVPSAWSVSDNMNWLIIKDVKNYNFHLSDIMLITVENASAKRKLASGSPADYFEVGFTFGFAKTLTVLMEKSMAVPFLFRLTTVANAWHAPSRFERFVTRSFGLLALTGLAEDAPAEQEVAALLQRLNVDGPDLTVALAKLGRLKPKSVPPFTLFSFSSRPLPTLFSSEFFSFKLFSSEFFSFKLFSSDLPTSPYLTLPHSSPFMFSSAHLTSPRLSSSLFSSLVTRSSSRRSMPFFFLLRGNH